MIGKYLVFFVAVILRSTADSRDRYNVVRNNYGFGNLNLNSLRGGRPTPYNFQNIQNVFDLSLERVRIQLFYECLCPDCREFDNQQLKPTVIALASHLIVDAYPYGNAKTEEHDGRVQITCQHGPPECYGNMLHACAIEHLQNKTLSVLYNSCMMDSTQAGRGSDDAAADVCGRSMGIDSEPIKQCAKSPRGLQLLKYYGDLSKKVNFNSVPHILINGLESTGDNFMKDVCNAFKNPPTACANLY